MKQFPENCIDDVEVSKTDKKNPVKYDKLGIKGLKHWAIWTLHLPNLIGRLTLLTASERKETLEFNILWNRIEMKIEKIQDLLPVDLSYFQPNRVS